MGNIERLNAEERQQDSVNHSRDVTRLGPFREAASHRLIYAPIAQTHVARQGRTKGVASSGILHRQHRLVDVIIVVSVSFASFVSLRPPR